MYAATTFASAAAPLPRSPEPCGAAGRTAAAVRGESSVLARSAHAAGLGCGTVAALCLRSTRRGPRAVARSALSQKEWRERCKEVAGGTATFEVTVSKPVGAQLGPFPRGRPGVGIEAFVEGAGCWALNEQVLAEGGDGMFVMEGDEILAVDGVDVEGLVDKVVECVKGSTADTITLTLSRNYLKLPKGPVKVVFAESGGTATMGRGKPFADAARFAGIGPDVDCEDPYFQEAATGKYYDICKDEVPANWDNIMPMVMEAVPGYSPGKKADDNLFGGDRGTDWTIKGAN